MLAHNQTMQDEDEDKDKDGLDNAQSTRLTAECRLYASTLARLGLEFVQCREQTDKSISISISQRESVLWAFAILRKRRIKRKEGNKYFK